MSSEKNLELSDHFIQEHPEAGVNFYTNDKEIKEIARKEMDIQERVSSGLKITVYVVM
nr:unnamed protein product [Callosobruchus chinensis]